MAINWSAVRGWAGKPSRPRVCGEQANAERLVFERYGQRVHRPRQHTVHGMLRRLCHPQPDAWRCDPAAAKALDSNRSAVIDTVIAVVT